MPKSMDIGNYNRYRWLLTILLGVLLVGLNENVTAEIMTDSRSFRNIILIGWDGVQREHLWELLNTGKLINLKSIIDDGTYVNIDIKDRITQTKPGWAKVLTGYDSKITGVRANLHYKAIPKGYTVFERLEMHFGDENIKTVLLGAVKHNLGIRGPHRICLNCVRGVEHFWWDENLSIMADPNEKKLLKNMESEPYLNAYKSIDIYDTGLGEANNVGRKILEYLEKIKNDKFFLFVQFYDPDTAGHIYGENSKQYSEAIMLDDEWLGKIVSGLKELKIYNETLIYVMTDHSFYEGQREHGYGAKKSWLVTNDKRIAKKKGEIEDITPTILKSFGFNLEEIKPHLQGEPLF